ncbi:MAG: hypothetical protein JNK87_42875 [Bryobacterales bacterium]|nr:hypothetical protein [Bryobacterales bacterium]
MEIADDIRLAQLPRLRPAGSGSKKPGMGVAPFPPELMAVLERDPVLRLRMLEAMESADGLTH